MAVDSPRGEGRPDEYLTADLHPTMKALAALVPDLAKIFPGCEVVLHDLRSPRNSIVAIAGGVTNRGVGGPVTDLVLKLLRSGRTDDNLVGYRARTPEGKPLSSSTLFVRDEKGKLIGCLCFNLDLSPWVSATQSLTQLISPVEPFQEEAATEDQETFLQDVEDMLQNAVAKVLSEAGIAVPYMRKHDKVAVVRRLDESGIFLIRGAMEYVAQALNVSRVTLYKYLEEARVNRDELI